MTGTIDSHTHIWKRASGDYDWITPEYAPINYYFVLADLACERAALGVDRVVLVQAADTAGDTDRMLAAADAHPEVLGVVAWLPLADAGLAAELDRRLASGKVVGMRALIHNMSDPEWVLREEVAAGLDVIADAGLSFDLVSSGPAALALVPRLVARHPSLRIVIDHLGKPPIGGAPADIDSWRSLLRLAAEAPTVAAKLSGLTSRGHSRPGDSVSPLRPIVDEALSAFGPRRLMFGGDWPMCLLDGGYTSAWNDLHDVLDLTSHELELIHSGTATSWYQLDERH